MFRVQSWISSVWNKIFEGFRGDVVEGYNKRQKCELISFVYYNADSTPAAVETMTTAQK